ncbi:MAG: glutamine-hydrolyzing GMP synthase [Candidatus Korarchaeota archaeon]
MTKYNYGYNLTIESYIVFLGSTPMINRAVIVDFGSQYTHLIARRIRELMVYSEIVPFWDADKISEAEAIILSGGPMSVYDEDSPKISRDLLESWIKRGIPILGICYGHQLLAHILGGKVEKGAQGEYGPTYLEIVKDSPLFNGLPRQFKVWMNHRDSVYSLPRGFHVVARTKDTPIAAFENLDLKIFGVQFHPEVEHTENGIKILDNFLSFCGCKRDWKIENLAEKKIKELRRRIGDARVIVAVSGGVDSTTLAYLLKKAIGNNLHVVFINTGFLREHEPEETLKLLRDLGFENIEYVDASERFIKEIANISDPEEKRQIFARVYAGVLEEVAKNLVSRYQNLRYFAQGTIYPDRIESAATGARPSKIKSHHNVVMPTIEMLEKLEPLADLYKDEVRKLAKELGLPECVYKKQPFPGPGLLVRILGKVTPEKLEICRKAHRIVEEEANKWGLASTLWQIFPVVLNSKSTGIKGDARAYEYIVAIRAVISSDGMTADAARLPWEFLETIARRITGEIPGVCRVLYDITSKPPATIEFE